MIRIFKAACKFVSVRKANLTYGGKLKYLRKKGANIGDQTRLNCSVTALGAEPYLVTIGRNCLIAYGVNFITHDGGVKVLSDLDYFQGERMDIIAPVTLGDNVYIGQGAYIMPGVTIGNNVVIGAGTIVTHDIPDNSVAAGVPCRVIKTIEEYYQSAVERGNLYPTARMSSKEKKEYFTSRTNK